MIMKKSDLSEKQFAILNSMKAGVFYKQRDLVWLSGVKKSTLQVAVNRLESFGLIDFVDTTYDYECGLKTVTQYTLTQKGEKFLNENLEPCDIDVQITNEDIKGSRDDAPQELSSIEPQDSYCDASCHADSCDGGFDNGQQHRPSIHCDDERDVFYHYNAHHETVNPTITTDDIEEHEHVVHAEIIDDEDLFVVKTMMMNFVKKLENERSLERLNVFSKVSSGLASVYAALKM